jgi:predicted DNA-binding transcriptional regulator AlpA
MSEDRLLKIDEAADRLQMSKDWLYRNWKKLPFTVHLSQRNIRFSLKGIEEYIEAMKNDSRREERHARERVPER